MQKNNPENTDSPQSIIRVGANETSSDWEFSGITLFRALGYVVGLLTFMVGTAMFMLGFSLSSETLVQVATCLYSVAVVSLAGRVLIDRLKPKNEIQALWVGLTMLCLGTVTYYLISFLIFAARIL